MNAYEKVLSPTENYTKRLSQVAGIWKTLSATQREKHVTNLNKELTECKSSSTFSHLSIFTLRTFSHLLSLDASQTAPEPTWSKHPKYTEPLLIQLIQLFKTCLTFTQDLQTTFFAASSKPFNYSFAFLISQLSSLVTDEPGIRIRVSALECLIALISVIDHGLLATFLPGIMACISNVLATSVRLHSGLAIPALTVLSILITRTFPFLNNQSEINNDPSTNSIADSLQSLSIFSKHTTNFSSSQSSSSQSSSLPTITTKRRSHAPPSKLVSAIPTSSPSSSQPLHAKLDESWISKTAEELRPRLAIIIRSKNGPRFHTSVSVRIALIRLLNLLLEQQYLPLDDLHISLFKFSVLELCSHSYESVSQQACSTLYTFFQHQPSHFETTVVSTLRFARFHNEEVQGKVTNGQKIDLQALKSLASTVSEDDNFSYSICSGCLSILIPTIEEENETERFIVPVGGRLKAFMHRVGVISFSNVLFTLHEQDWNPGRADRQSVKESLQNKIIQIAKGMGHAGLLPCIYDSLFSIASNTISSKKKSIANEDDCGNNNNNNNKKKMVTILGDDDGPDCDFKSFKRRAHASLVLQAVVKGALQSVISSSNLKKIKMSDLIYIRQCTKEVLELTSRLFVPNEKQIEINDMHRIDDTIISLKFALLHSLLSLTETLSKLHKHMITTKLPSSKQQQSNIMMGPIGSDIVLVFLMNLLRDTSHGESLIRQESNYTLQQISKIMRCHNNGVRELLLRHLNFIMSRVIRNLKYDWAGDVLGFVMCGEDGTLSDDLSREATLLLQKTLKGITDGLGGVSDERALQMLTSLKNILSTAVIQKMIMMKEKENNQHRKPRKKKRDEKEKEDEEITKTLLYYCTERIEDGDKEIAEIPLSSESENDFFDGFYSSEDDENENEGKDILKDISDTDGDNYLSTRKSFEVIAENSLDGCRDLMIGRPWNVRAAALECATYAVRFLKRRKKILLPHAAKILPLLPDQFSCLNEQLTAGERMMRTMRKRKISTVNNQKQFGIKSTAGLDNNEELIEDIIYMINKKGAELPVVLHTCKLLSALSECAGSFIRERFIKLIYPKMKPLLYLCEHFPTLLSNNNVMAENSPGYGAMAVCDACLEVLSIISIETPVVLKPYAKSLIGYLRKLLHDRYDPEVGSNRVVVHTNRSMVRFEKERWDRRVDWAENIIKALITVNEGDSFCALLCIDEDGPGVWKSEQADLHDIFIRSIE